MRPSLMLSIPQPCSESWDAMTPTEAGRHCAACQKTVVDFTQKTDTEILAYFAQPRSGICGRLWSDQLARTLQPARNPISVSRWRVWAAAAATVWGLAEAVNSQAAPRAPAAWHTHQPKKKGRTTPSAPGAPKLLIRGVVRNSATGEPLPGVAVFLKAENRNAITDSAGRFSLRVPAGRARRLRHTLVVHAFGFASRTVPVPTPAPGKAAALAIGLRADGAAGGAEVVGYGQPSHRQVMGGAIAYVDNRPLPVVAPVPAAGTAHRLFRWLSRPFRHGQVTN
jgi:hypothetical protein